MKIGLFGTGAYGLALSDILVKNNCEVTMWTKIEDEKRQLESIGKIDKYIPNYYIDKSIKVTNSVEECVRDKDLLIISIPAAFVSGLCDEMKNFINGNHILIATKGIEQETGLFISEIVESKLNTKNIAVISGPTFAKDIITGMPCGLSIAGNNTSTINICREALQNDYIKLRENDDMIGVEICGSIKNVIALAAGMLEGLKANESTKAMFITEAMHDMESILDSFNCNKRTVMSYAGIGDLLLTCTSIKSRNYSFGKLIGEKPGKEIIEEFIKNNTIEGYYTLESIYQLLKDKEVTIPIIDLIYDIVVNGKDPLSLLTFLVVKS